MVVIGDIELPDESKGRVQMKSDFEAWLEFTGFYKECKINEIINSLVDSEVMGKVDVTVTEDGVIEIEGTPKRLTKFLKDLDSKDCIHRKNGIDYDTLCEDIMKDISREKAKEIKE